MAAQKDAAPLSIETAVPLCQLAREQLKEAEIDALRHELSEARAQREAATAIAAAKVEAAERLIEELRAALSRETGLLRTERDRLAAELAEARKGWLERLLEALRRRS